MKHQAPGEVEAALFGYSLLSKARHLIKITDDFTVNYRENIPTAK
jgi:hypothetical protein